jgi:hypothetical protein
MTPQYDSTAKGLMMWATSELEHVGRIVSLKDKDLQYSYALSTDFSPNQQQSTLVDVFLKTELSKNQGLTLNVLAGENVDIQLFIRG